MASVNDFTKSLKTFAHRLDATAAADLPAHLAFGRGRDLVN